MNVPMPDWTFRDDLGNLVPSEIRTSMRAYGAACARAALDEAARVAQTPVAGEQDDITMAAKDRVAAAIRAMAKEIKP